MTQSSDPSPTLESMLNLYFNKFFVFISTEAMPGIQHPKLQKLDSMTAIEKSHWLRQCVFPLRDELEPYANTINTNDIVAGQTVQDVPNVIGVLEFLLCQVEPAYATEFRKIKIEHLLKIKQYLDCFVDILSDKK